MRSGRGAATHLLWLAIAAWTGCSTASAQVTEDWARFYDGPAHGFDSGRTMSLDARGNAYVVGSSDGIGTGKDIAVVKYDPAGELLWVARYDGPAGLDDWAYAAAMDSSASIYVAGETGTAGAGSDFTVVKFDSTGSQRWVFLYDGTAHAQDAALAVAVDGSGDIFAAGSSEGTGTAEDFLTVRLDARGDTAWVRRVDGGAHGTDEARTIAVDRTRVYVSGGSFGSGSDFDFLTVVYDKSGAETWSALYNGPGNGYDLVFYPGSLAVDAPGNVYVCGYSTGEDSTYDYAVVKYDAGGGERWVRRLAGDGMGNDDFADRLCLDDSSNVYVTGALYRQGDEHDIATVKYDSAGGWRWTAVYDGTGGGWDEGYDILALGGGIDVLGRSPGAGGSTDFVILMYDRGGSLLRDLRYSRAAGAYSWPFELERSGDGGLYAAGWSFGPGTGADFTIVRYTEEPSSAPLSPPRGTGSLLSTAWPNPFSRVTTISFLLTRPAPVQAALYDASGRKIRELDGGTRTAGEQRFQWDGTDDTGRVAPAGKYWYAVRAGREVPATGPVTLVR